VLNFAITEWMTGTAQVIIDNEGHITVVGEIRPPAEVELFAQRDYIKEIFKFEVRTLYGVPLVGNVFLFANIGLEALAKLGPGKIYNIALIGTYSTDPAVLQNFSLAASLNISAFAGLRLRAEGGLGVELLDHDIKAGVGLNALAGVRGYVEATPTIGYRETADPEQGKKGEYYIKGHMELAAQPFLDFSGDLFVELDSPWWSPAPDKTWTWPLGSLEYPLPGEFGIGANVDYIIGSPELPEIQFGEVNFDSGKFMTDLMNDHVPQGSSGEQERQGEWEEGAPTGEGAVDPTVAAQGGAPSGEPATGQQQPGDGEPPSPEVMQRWGQGMEALRALSERSKANPFNEQEIAAALAPIKTRYGFSHLRASHAGEDWRVHAAMNPEGDITMEGEPATEGTQPGLPSDEGAQPGQPAAGGPDDPYITPAVLRTPTEQEAAGVPVGEPLDIAASGYSTGWAGNVALVSAVYVMQLNRSDFGPLQPGAAYVPRLRNGRPVSRIRGGYGAFTSYGRTWRKVEAIPQLHHIASDKGEGGANFRSHPAFSLPYGISIQDPANKIFLFGHAGPHEANYHTTVQQALDSAVQAAGGPTSPRLKDEVLKALNSLRTQIQDGALLLYKDKDVWE
jgi:hypothetical protein